MGSFYKILGLKVPSWVLSAATISGAVGAGVYSSAGKSDAAAAPADAAPATKSEELDVEKLLNDFLKDGEGNKTA
ncbi:hypothetical protein DASC09_038840 [Saccharomycopsis crataegensis]|uniref:Uncharacterized protein n=1 Tax=Saccharomycopsis crataegensis TaxID=43959 RepID=A0AAV5QPG4_9ASCO|nr:hypothetical protein DASC09_038840 [Saccharomycopsis crataegensis]